MIACHDDHGRITNIYADPVPEGLAAHLAAVGIAHVEFASHEPAPDLIASCLVRDGALIARPAIEAVPVTAAGAISITGLPAGATAEFVFDAGTPFETRHSLAAVAGVVDLAIDEAGPVRVIVRAPWPYRESVHDLVL